MFSKTVWPVVRLLLFSTFDRVCSQTFGDGIFYPPPGGLSTACNATWTTPINCTSLLAAVAWQVYFPSTDDLNAICTGNCRQSLDAVRQTQLTACGSNVLMVHGQSFPATYNLDYFLFTYNYTCRKDTSTNAWCAQQFDLWGNQTTPSANETCSDCVLGTLQLQLDSPFGYDVTEAGNFTSMTSSCRATQYPITSPAPYTASPTVMTTSTPPASTPSCAATVTVGPGDTCYSISIAHNVSTFELLYNNGLEAYCSNFPTAGTKLCLPPQCSVYTVRANDSCWGIAAANHNAFTISQLISWNGNMNRGCSNLDQLVGSQICTSFPGTSGGAPVTTPSSVAAPVPPNLAAGTNTNCSLYYNVSVGDYCSYITVQQGISLKDFYFLNPEINSTDCSNLLLGYSYCVAPVGDISTYPGYSVGSTPSDPCSGLSAASSCFATTYTEGPAWDWPTATTATATTTGGPLPFASGTLSNCSSYTQYYQPAANSTAAGDLNGCYSIARFFSITPGQLTAWNPSLQFDSSNPSACTLSPGFGYCVSMSTGGTITTSSVSFLTTPPPTTTIALTGTCSGGVPPPEQTQNGAPCWCQRWEQQQTGKYCQDMADAAGITLAQFYALNPPLNGTCDNLWAGYAYCVAPAPAFSATTTTTAPAAIPSCAGGTAPPEQTQPGISCKCNRWTAQQSGKYCQDMADAAGITLAQLYTLNPALNGACSGLWAGYAYCVGLAQ